MSSVYRPFSAAVERLRLLFQRRVKDGQLAYLGNGAGVVEVPNKSGYVYARFPGGKDANGFARFSTPFIVRASGAGYLNYEGAAVYVAIGYNGEVEIVASHFAELDKAGIDTRVLNPLSQQSKWVYPWQLTYALPSAVANNFVASFLVTIKKFLHYVGNVFSFYETNDSTEMIDMEPYVPAVDMHLYAALWLDTYTNTVVITTSTAQSLFTPLDLTDIQELVTERPPDATPLKAFYLSNDQTTLTQSIQEVDLRQWLNFPEPFGFPNPVAYQERIRAGYQQLYAGILVVTGSIIVEGALIGLVDCCGGGSASGGMTDFEIAGDSGTPITVSDGDTVTLTGDEGIETETSGFSVIIRGRKFTIDAGNPNAGDDDTQGYVPFSLWINTSTQALWYCEDNSTASAVWHEIITSDIIGQELDTKVLINPIIDFIFDPNGDVAAVILGDGNAANADSVAFGTFTDIPRIYVNTFSTNRNLEIRAAGTGNIVSSSTIRSDTDNTDDLGTTAIKWREVLTMLATFEERSAPSTPAGGDYSVYAKAVGGGAQLFGKDDAGVEKQISESIAILLDSKATTTQGGSSSAATWNNRDLNTEHYDPDGIVTIGSNQFTPVAGDYELYVASAFMASSAAGTSARNRLFNVTGGAAVTQGLNTNAITNSGGTAILRCKFTANGTDAYRIDTYTTQARATVGLGQQVGDGSNEIYTILVLRKVA